MPYLRKGHVVSLESTIYPGTTEEELLPRLQVDGLKVGEDVFLVYSPEREDPGNLNFSTRSIPKVVGGHTAACLEVGAALYQSAIDQIVADHMGIDIHEVIDAAATKPFGFTPYYPGPVLGGHCIPIDPFLLDLKS